MKIERELGIHLSAALPMKSTSSLMVIIAKKKIKKMDVRLTDI